MEDIGELRPLDDRILVKCAEDAGMTKSGLLIAGTAVEAPTEGTVIRLGPGKFDPSKPDKGREPIPDVKEGDHIIFTQFAGTDIEVKSGETYTVLQYSDLLGTK